MFRRLIYLVSFALVPGVFLGVANADIETGLVGYWPLDEGAGTTVADASGRGHNGVFAEGTPEWVEGMFGKALKFDGVNKVEIPDHPDFHPEDAVSIALWAKPEAGQLDWGKLFCRRASTGEYLYKIDYDSSQQIRASVTTSSGSFTASPRPPNFPGEWGHLCLTYDGSAVILYKDGEEVARIAASGKLQQDDVSLSIGGRLGSGQNFTGIIDDVRLYNRALTPAEIKQIMQGPPAGPASDPSPDVGAQDVPRETILSWTPGEFAPAVNGHIVYLSESFNDVNDGLGGTTHSASNYAPPQRLDFETTYYWRVDEVNAPPDSTVFPGDVWSFTTEPIGYAIENLTATASSTGQADFGPEKTIDGSGLDDNGLHSTAATDSWGPGSNMSSTTCTSCTRCGCGTPIKSLRVFSVLG
ncbi:MAG: LamG domain-containing protein [Planctomycetota bacterium]